MVGCHENAQWIDAFIRLVFPLAHCDVALNGQVLTAGMDWHLRMGHLGIPMMQELSIKGKIPRLINADLVEVK